MTDNYLLDHGWAHEHERLLALGELFDPGTRRALADRGLAPGWRCLEVAAGSGTIARWLATQVGETGTVVATDLSTGFLEQVAAEVPNLEARRHDIINDPPEAGAYDLVHTRFLLEHLSSWRVALANMAASVRPGGWLVVEAIEWGNPRLAVTGRRRDPRALALAAMSPVIRVLVGASKLLNVDIGAQLPAELEQLGMTEVTAEGRSVFISGGGAGETLATLTLAHYRDLATARAPALKGAVGRGLDAVSRSLTGPGLWSMAPPVVAAAGRRPPA